MASEETRSVFDRFIASYPPDGPDGPSKWTDADTIVRFGQDVADYTLFQRTHGGCASFGGGLLRFLGKGELSSSEWNGPDGWRVLWPGRPDLVVFAYDWLARQFAFDGRRLSQAEPLVTLLDPSDAAVMESDFTFRAFLDWLAGPDGEGGLSTRLYQAWRAAGGAAPGVSECVCFKHPLVLGGKQTVENLEVGDMDVQLTILAQLHAQIAKSRAKR
jgi:hypothetical protein